jgi:hypothetical protein
VLSAWIFAPIVASRSTKTGRFPARGFLGHPPLLVAFSHPSQLAIDEPADVYIPFQLDTHSTQQGHYFNVAGRLKPGVTLAAANARLQASYLTGYLRFGSIGDS